MHFTRILKELFKDYRFIFAFIVLCLLVILALMSAFSPYDPTIWFVVPRDRPPHGPYWEPIPKARISSGRQPLP